MVLRLDFFNVLYSGWVSSMTPPCPTLILEEKLIQYYYNLIQFLGNLPKIIPSQKNCWYYLIDADIISLFAASKGKKIQKIDEIN